jgi:hypothetical protein
MKYTKVQWTDVYNHVLFLLSDVCCKNIIFSDFGQKKIILQTVVSCTVVQYGYELRKAAHAQWNRSHL